ncbi:Protein ENL, partial [Dissostichus eleginoides]
MPAGDDDYSRGVFEVWKSLSPPLNINKQLAAVTNTDKREINCGDRDAYRESQKEENDHNRNKDREARERQDGERRDETGQFLQEIRWALDASRSKIHSSTHGSIVPSQ